MEFAVHLMDVLQIQGNSLIIIDFQVAYWESVNLEGRALQVGAAHASGHAFFFLKNKVVDEGGDGLWVENGARGTRVDEEAGFLTMNHSLNHDMEAFSFDVKQLQRNFNIASHHQKFGLMAYFL